MANIFKYRLPAAGEPFQLRIRGFQEIVHVGEDGQGDPCLWAQVNPSLPEESWTFMLAATGQEFDADKWCHVRSFVQANALVWHLMRPFEKAAAAPQSAVLGYFVAPARTDGRLPLLTDSDVHKNRIYESFDQAKEARDKEQAHSQHDLRIYSVYAITQQETTCEVPF